MHTLYVDSNTCFNFISIKQQLQQRAILNTLLPSSGENLNFSILTNSTPDRAKITVYICTRAILFQNPLNLFVLAKDLFVHLNIIIDNKMNNTFIH